MQAKRVLLLGMSGLSVFFYALSALAAQSAPQGIYLEGNGGYSTTTGLSLPGNVSDEGFGGNANIGYKFMPYFAAEVGYSLYANSNSSDPLTDSTAATQHTYSYDIAAKGIWPVPETGFEVFAKLGIDRMNANVSIANALAAFDVGASSGSHSATGLYAGVGGQFYFTQALAGVVQWQRAGGNSSTGSGNLFTAGFSYLFT